MNKTPSVIIVGAGIGGLSCALALQQQGIKPVILEQASALSEVGAGLQLSPNGMSVLRRLGLEATLADKGFNPEGIHSVHWRTGNTIARVPFAALDFHAPYLHIHRADLQKTLADAVTRNDPDCIHLDCFVEAILSDQQQATVIRRHQESVSADWLIGADGIRSRCRDYVVRDNASPRFTGNIAWRGLLRTEDVPEALRPARWANIWMGPGGHVVIYYLRGGELINFVAVREQDDWLEESWNAPASLRDLLYDFADWDPKLFQLLSYTDPKSCYRWALFDRDPISQWYRDRVVLLGDAAHPMLPFLAQGASMAIEDGWELSQWIGENDMPQRYQAARAERCANVQQLARDNMVLFHHRNPLLRMGRDMVARTLATISPTAAARRVQWIYDWQASSARS